MKLAEKNFTEFRKWRLGEGGINTTRIEDYFESGKVKWGVDSNFETQSQGESEIKQEVSEPV